jgi:hypothetical protein
MFFQSRDMDSGLIELFVDGTENALPDSGRLDGLGLGSGSVVFMLQRLGWHWEECGYNMTLSGKGEAAASAAKAARELLGPGPGFVRAQSFTPEASVRIFLPGWEMCVSCKNMRTLAAGVKDWPGTFTCEQTEWNELYNSCEKPEEQEEPQQGLMATLWQKAVCGNSQLVTGGSPMTEGRHYWEVELTWDVDICFSMVGAARPGLDHDTSPVDMDDDDVYFIYGRTGALFGNGKKNSDKQGKFAKGDRIGVLLDLDAGWMRFYRNDKRCGPGFTEGVTGPLVRATELHDGGDKVTALPGAVAPEGAGGADEPWEPESDAESESEPEADY